VFSYICSAGMICETNYSPEEDSPRSGDFFAPLKSPFSVGMHGDAAAVVVFVI